jgi:hypothetical protein
MVEKILAIDSEQVHNTFLSCLYKKEEITDGQTPEGTVIVEGVMAKIGFQPIRLESTRQQVISWLQALPHEFRKDDGGGWSFLNGCILEGGEQWTGMQLIVDELFCLGMGLGLAKYQLPREMWNALPGGVPYYVIDIK